MFKHLINKLKDFKLAYLLFNLFQPSKLRHNKPLYKKLQIKKPVYWSVSSADFAGLPESRPWLDQPGAKEALIRDEKYSQLPEAIQVYLQHWIDNGFIILKNFLTTQQVDAINDEVASLLQEGKLKVLGNGKIMFAFKQSPFLQSIVSSKGITELFEFILGQPIIPFQSINFLKGSEQRAHSDSIHMTTYPLGYLAASWFALEEVDESNGSLFYYPGSHKLPYVLSPDIDQKKGVLRLDPLSHERYEDKMMDIIDSEGLRKENFHAQRGDVFLWHANLIHGGNPITDTSKTRKSMVVHYFAKNVIKYHEISRRPALLDDY